MLNEYLNVATSSLNASKVDSSSTFSMSRNLIATSPCQYPAWTVLNLLIINQLDINH